MKPTIMKLSELQLADRVHLSPDQPYDYCYATVQEITGDQVIFLRPYVHTADFSCGGRVITYLGWEEVRLFKESDRPVELVYRTALK